MSSAEQLNRMISFRLTKEEYDRCRQLCQEKGMSSVSEIARTALDLLFQQPSSDTLEARLAAVEQRIQELSREFESLTPPSMEAAESAAC